MKASEIFTCFVVAQTYSWVTPHPWYSDLVPLVGAAIFALTWKSDNSKAEVTAP
jgi:hypothetical protein